MRSHQHSLMGLKIQASQAPPINKRTQHFIMSHCEISFISLQITLIATLQESFFNSIIDMQSGKQTGHIAIGRVELSLCCSVQPTKREVHKRATISSPTHRFNMGGYSSTQYIPMGRLELKKKRKEKKKKCCFFLIFRVVTPMSIGLILAMAYSTGQSHVFIICQIKSFEARILKFSG